MNSFAPVLLPSGYRLCRAAVYEGQLSATVAMTRKAAACPLCHQRSRRVHSWYWRTLTDQPANGRPVTLRVSVRRFVCGTASCPRRIFAEPLTDLAGVRARRTDRLRSQLERLGFALGGRAGERLGDHFELPGGRSTLLRLVRAAPPPAACTPRVLGVDDWAFRKGRRYGTILVDLETHRTVDLLPERSSESLAGWLKAHPGVEIISRDRATVYAEGARVGAPTAIQVADRWHLVQNLQGALEQWLDHRRRQLRAAENSNEGMTAVPQQDLASALAAGDSSRRSSIREQQQRVKRVERYEQVRLLHQQGFNFSQIAERMGLDRATVRRYVQAEVFPERASPLKRPTQLDPFAAYLRQRWQEGCHNAAQLFRELRARGYRGGRTQLKSFVHSLRPSVDQRAGELPKATKRAPSARQVSWLLLREPADLEERDRAYLDRLSALEPAVTIGWKLAQDFLVMVRQRLGHQLSTWLQSAHHSGIGELSRFARGIERDEAAVKAGLTLPWSNGPTEGSVHRLKMIKRQMYGRANFDLLRARVLA